LLSAGKWLANNRSTFTDDERDIVRTMHFLSAKPMLYAINVGMEDLPAFASLQTRYCADL
jgi:ribosome-binding ATPase YchF (GTP1/OBG family)